MKTVLIIIVSTYGKAKAPTDFGSGGGKGGEGGGVILLKASFVTINGDLSANGGT